MLEQHIPWPSLGQSDILGVFSCLEMQFGNGKVQAAVGCAGVVGKAALGGSLNLGVIYFISWEAGKWF